MSILEMDYKGLRKVISGGQNGADRGGLEGAVKQGIDTGGWAPKGWRTADGPRPILAEFGLKEHSSEGYAQRTKQNVKDSDGTLIIASNPDSVGTRLTIQSCVRFNKPFMTLGTRSTKDELDFIVAWVLENNIEVLNVAGNRDNVSASLPYMHHTAARKAVEHLIVQLRFLGKLNGT